MPLTHLHLLNVNCHTCGLVCYIVIEDLHVLALIYVENGAERLSIAASHRGEAKRLVVCRAGLISAMRQLLMIRCSPRSGVNTCLGHTALCSFEMLAVVIGLGGPVFSLTDLPPGCVCRVETSGSQTHTWHIWTNSLHTTQAR